MTAAHPDIRPTLSAIEAKARDHLLTFREIDRLTTRAVREVVSAEPLPSFDDGCVQ